MTVTSVAIRNYRAIKQLHLPLHPQLTVLHGANGSGKTSILTAIALALAPRLYGSQRRIDLDSPSNLVPTISLSYGLMLESRVEGNLKGWGHTDSESGTFIVGEAAGGEQAPIHMFYDTSRKVVSSEATPQTDEACVVRSRRLRRTPAAAPLRGTKPPR